MTSLRALLLAVALPSALVLAGCSNDVGSSGNQGYVAGKGIITSVKAADRKQPGEVAGRTLDGKQVSLADFRGKVVVVNVWGSWCGPCRAEAPMLAQASRDLAKKGVVFLGIDSRDPSKDAAKAFVRRFDVPYPSLYDQQGSTLLAFRGTLTPNSVPSTVVVDPQGRVSGSVLGSLTRTTLDDLVDDASSGGGA
ncbi:MAG TPA: TlpA disulfide reductase family protein [Nocardioidaceae bacterium]|nr:TlpA disulfide reductase family protein [Nocardioidaceae bacterium]